MHQTTSLDCVLPTLKTPYKGLWDSLEKIGRRVADLLGVETRLSSHNPAYKDYMHPQLIRLGGDPFIILEREVGPLSRIFTRRKKRIILEVYFNFGEDPWGEIKYLIKNKTVREIVEEELALFQKEYGTRCLELRETFVFPHH